MTTLSENEHKVLAQLCSGGEGTASRPLIPLTDLVAATQLDQAQVDPAVRSLEGQGFAEMTEEPYQEYRLGKEGKKYAKGALPERIIVEALQSCEKNHEGERPEECIGQGQSEGKDEPADRQDREDQRCKEPEKRRPTLNAFGSSTSPSLKPIEAGGREQKGGREDGEEIASPGKGVDHRTGDPEAKALGRHHGDEPDGQKPLLLPEPHGPQKEAEGEEECGTGHVSHQGQQGLQEKQEIGQGLAHLTDPGFQEAVDPGADQEEEGGHEQCCSQQEPPCGYPSPAAGYQGQGEKRGRGEQAEEVEEDGQG